MKWAHHPNLRKRPRTPAKGRGSVQRAIKRAFAASDTEVLTSSSIYDWAYVRRRRGRRKSMPFGVYSRTLRTLQTMCEPVERVPPHGAWAVALAQRRGRLSTVWNLVSRRNVQRRKRTELGCDPYTDAFSALIWWAPTPNSARLARLLRSTKISPISCEWSAH